MLKILVATHEFTIARSLSRLIDFCCAGGRGGPKYCPWRGAWMRWGAPQSSRDVDARLGDEHLAQALRARHLRGARWGVLSARGGTRLAARALLGRMQARTGRGVRTGFLPEDEPVAWSSYDGRPVPEFPVKLLRR